MEDSNDGATSSTPPEITPPKPDMYAPPPYEECDGDEDFTSSMTAPLTSESSEVQPPSYEEVQRLKAMEAAEDFPPPHCQVSML